MNKQTIAIILFTIAIIMLTYMIHEQIKIQEQQKRIVERYAMLRNHKEQFGLIQGAYHTDGYYCIWTKGRNKTEIATTEVHEQCHALIHKDHHHYCNNITN